MDIIKRILAAGLKAPTNDHLRYWEFVVVTDATVIASILGKIPKKASEKRVDFVMGSWKLKDECQQRMYRDAIPKQYGMLSASGCLILQFFKQREPLLEAKSLSSLNPFASVWCCVENILLAATAEGLAGTLRIPPGGEREHIAGILNHPKEYIMPCYIAIGYPSPDAVIIEQIERNIEDKLHIDRW